jgi:hypothetical protein
MLAPAISGEPSPIFAHRARTSLTKFDRRGAREQFRQVRHLDSASAALDLLLHLGLDRNNQGLGGRLADARFEPGLLTLVAILHMLKSSE